MRGDGYRVEVEGTDRLSVDEAVLARVAAEVGERVFRVDVTRPGFGHLALGGGRSAEEFRRLLVRLGFALGAFYRARFDQPLLFTQLGRFDQQVSTEAHRDGAPDESVLLLGYEPTLVASRLSLLDFTRAAVDRGLSPRDFLERFNPLTPEGKDALAAYATAVDRFDGGRHHVVVVNNSVLPPSAGSRGMLGVLHKGEIPNPDPSATRMIDSLVLAPPLPGVSGVDPSGVRAFIADGRAVVN